MPSCAEPVLRSEDKVSCSIIQHSTTPLISSTEQGPHRLEKYLNLEGFLEKSLEIKPALKSTQKPGKVLEFYYFL